ncbi:MAG TPA: prenyltransferase/squalene oxidase repeat-containing protein [Acidobacteriota bacterium]|nr:prenyltransferase/squalene oxidase repeat-containing protein [Acidobacteriota bacterium]
MAVVCHWRLFTESPAIDLCLRQILERRLPTGVFSEHLHGLYRPDSTAWAILALASKEGYSVYTESARACLAANQLQDGRIAFPDANSVFWPTAIAVFAWQGAGSFDQAQNRALKFLLETTGKHWPYDPKAPIAHDPSIKGWPWVGETHSFVDPTAMTLLALDIAGQSKHPRFREGIGMLLNRQLPHGGWNYGNTLVYGRELRPFADTTGIALAALAGHVAKEQINASLRYLQAQAEKCRTPLSLAWALFGLGAWGEFPNAGRVWICETLDKQKKYGSYGTSLLSILALAYVLNGDIRKGIA